MAKSVLQRLFSFLAPEERASINDERYWSEFYAGIATKSGQTVSPDSALQNTIVYACVRVIAETIASLPLMIYRRRSDGGKEPAPEHHLYNILHDQPNTDQTSYELREMKTGHVCLRGNAYSYIERDNGGFVLNLYPLHPARMKVSRNDRGAVVYEYTWENGSSAIYQQRDIWHWRGLSTDGMVGLSPVTLARESIGLSNGAEDYAARFLANNSRPSGILSTPGKVLKEQADRLSEAWQAAHSGANAHKVAVVDGGLTWTAVGLSNEDSQFLELRNYQVEDIARIFRVPAVLIGHPDKTMTYASAEQFFLSFAVHTVRPWLVRIEQSISRCLLTERERKKYFAEFKIEGLLRGDIKSRYEAYQIGRQNGWLSANDVRMLESMNPIDNGDIYLQPMNFQEAGAPIPAPTGAIDDGTGNQDV